MISLKDIIKEIEENKGLWANIHAKRKRGEKPAKKGSEAYKKAKAAADKINKEEIEEAEYQGRDVKLNKPTRGDTKKFKVYVNTGKE